MMMAHRYRFAAAAILSAMLLVALAGCGDGSLKTYRAGGKVVFPDGKPLESGWVEFRSVGGEQPVVARGEIQPDGTFQLSTYRPGDGAVEGECRALVNCPPPSTRRGEAKVVQMPIDPRFTRFDTSGWKFTVTRYPAQNQFTLQVDRPGK